MCLHCQTQQLTARTEQTSCHVDKRREPAHDAQAISKHIVVSVFVPAWLKQTFYYFEIRTLSVGYSSHKFQFLVK